MSLADIPFPPEFLAWLASAVLGGIGGCMIAERQLRRRRMRNLPVAPQGVVVYFEDGTSQAMEMRFDGIDADGVARWVNTVPITKRPVSMSCVVLPPLTMIVLQGPAEEWPCNPNQKGTE